MTVCLPADGPRRSRVKAAESFDPGLAVLLCHVSFGQKSVLITVGAFLWGIMTKEVGRALETILKAMVEALET